MTLIIGGAGQGKLDYVLHKTGYGQDQVAHDPEEARTRPIFDGLEHWPGLDENELLALAASAEKPSEHPLAGALIEDAEKKGINKARHLLPGVAQKKDFCGHWPKIGPKSI